MGLIALGFLAWYYTQAIAGRSRAEAAQASKTKQHTQGEMALPPLGRVDPPMVEKVLGPPPVLPPTSTFAFDGFQGNDAQIYPAPSTYASAPPMPREQGIVDRRLAGPVFVMASTSATPRGEQGVPDAMYVSDVGTGRAARLLVGDLHPSRPAVGHRPPVASRRAPH